MSREQLRAANRAVLRAIETPPDTGIERRLDDIAAECWFLAEEKERRPDQGRLARVEFALAEAIRDAPEPRTRHLSAARDHLAAYRSRVDPV